MFCPNCGQTLAEGSRFCANCGNNLTANQVNLAADYQAVSTMQQYQLQKSAARQSELRVLDSLIMHFSQKQEQYDNYDMACEAVSHYSRGARKGLIVWGAILAVVGFILLLADAAPASVSFLLFLLPGLFMIFGGIMVLVANKKNYQNALNAWQQLSDDLCAHYAAYPNCPVGPEYSNPQILQVLRNTLQSGRADTIKECLNLMIADANQRAMEKYLEEIQHNVEQIQSSARQSARANTASAIFLAASFFR